MRLLETLKLSLLALSAAVLAVQTATAQPVYISPSQRTGSATDENDQGAATPQIKPSRQSNRVILSPVTRGRQKLPEIRKQAAMDRMRLEALNAEAARGREELRLTISAIFDQTKNIDPTLLQGRSPQTTEELEQLYFVNTAGLRVETVKAEYEKKRRQLEYEALLIAGTQEDARTQHLRAVAKQGIAENAEYVDFGAQKLPRRLFEFIRRQPR